MEHTSEKYYRTPRDCTSIDVFLQRWVLPNTKGKDFHFQHLFHNHTQDTMIATIHDERPIQDKPDMSMLDPNRNIPLFKLHYPSMSLPNSRIAKTAHDCVYSTNCTSRDLTRRILLEALAYAEEVGASSNILMEPQSHQINRIPDIQPTTRDIESRRRRLSSPTIMVPSMTDQEARVAKQQHLSRSEHGTSSSVVTMTTGTRRRGSLGSSSSGNSSFSCNGGNRSNSSSPRVSPLVRKTRNAEWVVVDSNSSGSCRSDTEVSDSSSRVRAAFALMQENSLPSPKVIRIAALDASTRNKNVMDQQLPLHNTTTTSQSCPSGMHSRAMEAAALKKQHGRATRSKGSKGATCIQPQSQQQQQRRMLQRSQSLGHRSTTFATTPSPSRLLQRSQSLGTGRLSLPMPSLLETIDESNEGVSC